MTAMSKLCDAADWFRPEVAEIITNELRETPRFHRKQWESAMIFLALRKAGLLRPDKVGLSMGGGRELVLYALAQHIQQLVVTDLYDAQTDWDCARTDDPDAFIRMNKPFPVDDERLRVLRMDMRELAFPDRSFDFCYSTCAVEHIGSREDFLHHFNEVARVLVDDGIYVFTTEVLYGDQTINDEHNVVFSLQDLHSILAESDLIPEEEFDACVTQHKINYPTPSNLRSLSHFTPKLLTEGLLQESPHIQLMRGRHPFTSGLFLTKKRTNCEKTRETRFIGLESSRKFMEYGVNVHRNLILHSAVSIHPFSLLPGESSRFFADHAEFLNQDNLDRLDCETVFHSDYFWFAGGKRVFDVVLDPADETESEIELRIHRMTTLASREVDCGAHSIVSIEGQGRRSCRIETETDVEHTYAILAKIRSGPCMFKSIEIKSYPVQLAPDVSLVLAGSASFSQIPA